MLRTATKPFGYFQRYADCGSCGTKPRRRSGTQNPHHFRVTTPVLHGLLEAETEMGENGAGIVTEPTLVLKYDLEMRFYLSRHSAVLQPVLVSALATAERNGFIKKFSQNYYKSITRSSR